MSENSKVNSAMLGGIFLGLLLFIGVVTLAVAEDVPPTDDELVASAEVVGEEVGFWAGVSNSFKDNLNNRESVEEAEADRDTALAELDSVKSAHTSEIEALTKEYEDQVLRDINEHTQNMSDQEARLKSAKFEYESSVGAVAKFCESFAASVAK